MNIDNSLSELLESSSSSVENMAVKISHLEEKMLKIEKFSAELSGLATASLSSGGASDNLDNQVEEWLANATLPIQTLIDNANTALDSMPFDPEIYERAESGIKGAYDQFITKVEESTAQVKAYGQEAVSEVNVCISLGSTAINVVINEGSQANQQAIDSANNLIETLEESIPTVGDSVAILLEQHFAQEVEKQVRSVLDVLNQLEEIVSGVGERLIGQLGEVADVVEEINQIIEPLDPALKLFDDLS